MSVWALDVGLELAPSPVPAGGIRAGPRRAHVGLKAGSWRPQNRLNVGLRQAQGRSKAGSRQAQDGFEMLLVADGTPFAEFSYSVSLSGDGVTALVVLPGNRVDRGQPRLM